MRKAGAGLRVWIVPLALASVFLVLFAMANPVIDDILRSIDLGALWNLLDFWRISFWLVIAIGIWALLRPRLPSRSRTRSLASSSSRRTGLT